MNKQICPNCHKVYTPDLVQRDDWEERKAKRREGGYIQDVWHDATPIQREQILTGLCSDDCWDQFLGVGVDDNKGNL